MDKLRDTDELNDKLKEELGCKTLQLINSSNDLAQSHTELLKSRREINVSFTLNKKFMDSFNSNIKWLNPFGVFFQ